MSISSHTAHVCFNILAYTDVFVCVCKNNKLLKTLEISDLKNKLNQFLNDTKWTDSCDFMELGLCVTQRRDVRYLEKCLTDFPDMNHPERLNVCLFYSVCKHHKHIVMGVKPD